MVPGLPGLPQPPTMLNSQLLQPLLLQLLQPVPALTPVLPLSASLISARLQKPLLSCISKSAIEQDGSAVNGDYGFTDAHTTQHANSTYFMNESTPLLGRNDSNGNNGSNGGINRSKSPLYTDEINGNGVEPIDSNMSLALAKTRLDELQKEIDNLEENYDSDYIDANVNPIDNLNILSLLVIRDWSQRQEKDNWKVYSFNKYRLYMYHVNDDYTLLLCSTEDFPAAIAISKLDDVAKILSSKL